MLSADELTIRTRLLALSLLVARQIAVTYSDVPDDGFEAIAKAWIEAPEAGRLPQIPGQSPDEQLLIRAALGDQLHEIFRLARDFRRELRA